MQSYKMWFPKKKGLTLKVVGGVIPPVWARRSLLNRCVRNMFLSYLCFFFFTLFLYLMHWMQHFPIFASHHHGNYRPIPACIFTKWHFSRSFISLPSTELSAHPFGVPHSAFLPLSHLSSFHLYFSLLIFVHQSQIFAYNVHGNDRVCKSF